MTAHLSPEDRDELVNRAHDEIGRLCEGGRWRMTIPADMERDSDLVLTAALDAQADEINRLRSAVESLIPLTNPELIEAGYSVLASDVIAAIRDA